MRGTFAIILLAFLLPSLCAATTGEQGVVIRLESQPDAAAQLRPALFSLPPEEARSRYDSERAVYIPGENVRVTVEVPANRAAGSGRISLVSLLSGERQNFHEGTLTAGTYGPYDVPIAGDFEIYRVNVETGSETVSRTCYGIRPSRGMKDFAEEVSPFGISLRYNRPGLGGLGVEMTTPWDEAVTEGGVSPRGIDLRWALGAHMGEGGSRRNERWLWTDYACGMVDLQSGRTGLFWGEYNPWNRPVPRVLKFPEIPLGGRGQTAIACDAGFQPAHFLHPSSLPGPMDAMLPNEIYLREWLQPMLREWAENVNEKHPGMPLRISLGDGWGIGQAIGTGCDPEILRFFVSWMKELFGITIEAETFKELLDKCREHPKHLEYFIARNTTFRSLELTVQAVQEVVADSRAWDRNGESNRQLIALPEAKEFCEILSRCISVGTSNDWHTFRLAGRNPLSYGFANVVVKAFAPGHRLCVGWTGCPRNATESEILRWYLEPAWLTVYDAKGRLQHVITHSPPRGPENVWRPLDEMGVTAEKIRLHDKCFQLMEAIGVERPVGPVLVCKDWTFAGDKSGEAWRSDLYESFLISLRRHKVPISCAVHADNEASLPGDLPRVYAPRMNGKGEVRFGYRAGSEKESFTCEPSAIPESLMSEFAIRLNAACGNPVVFPPGSSIEGYAFEAKGMIFVVAEEIGGHEEKGQLKVNVSGGEWVVADVIAGREVKCWHEGEYVAFESSLQANGATLFCLSRRGQR